MDSEAVTKNMISMPVRNKYTLGKFNAVTNLVALLATLLTLDVFAGSVEQETLKRLDQLRAIKADGDSKTIERYNKQMDEMWQYFIANKASSLPVLRSELVLELKKSQPNNLLLLDTGYFVRLQDSAADKELGKEALFKIDPTAKIVRLNQQQLFTFAHAVAPDRDPRTLPFLDQAFLRGKVTAFIPQHSLRLDETLVCAFLYGIYGPGAEAHLKNLLSDRTLANKIIETLIWIGSPDSISEVNAAMKANRGYETFARGTAFMMKNGGPQGRAAMLAINPKDFDAKSQEYYEKIRKDIEATTYDVLQKQFSSFPGGAKLGDDELKKRLSDMYKNYGKDSGTNPAAILNSGLKQQYLIGELSRIRARMFYRLSDEALSDVEMTNAILNALRYKAI